MMCWQSGAFGNGNGGFVCSFGGSWLYKCNAQMNGAYGIWSDNGSGNASWYCNSTGNGIADFVANLSSSAILITPGSYSTSSPPVNVVGNLNSIFTTFDAPETPSP